MYTFIISIYWRCTGTSPEGVSGESFLDSGSINLYIYLPVFLVVLSAVSLIPVISFLMMGMTGSESLSTISVSVFGLTYALSSIIAGFIHSIYRSELKVISYSLIGMMAGVLLFYSWNPWLFILGRGAIGFFESFVFVGYIGALLRIFKTHEEGTYAIGKFFSIMGIALVVGPLLGAAYVNRGLIELSFPGSLLLLVMAFILVKRGSYRLDKTNIYTRAGLSIPKLNGILVLAIIMVLAVGSVDGVIQSRSVIWFDKLGADPALGGILMTIYYFFTIVTETLIPYIYKRIRHRLFPYLLLLTGLPLIIGMIHPISLSDGDGLYYLVYLSIIALIFAINMGIVSPLGTERLVRSFGENYLIGSGLVNTIWSISYFITPSILGYLETTPNYDTTVLNILLISILVVLSLYMGRYRE